MAQQNIDFGTFPDDPDADPIRVAFQKVQQNFDEIYAGLAGQAVLSVNKTPGSGISVNAPTGNVVVSANIACVQVTTSSLSIGRDGNGSNSATITTSSQTLVVDINPNVTSSNTFRGVLNANTNPNALANLQGVITANAPSQPNITSVGTLTSLLVSGNITAANITSNNAIVANYFVGDGGNLTNVFVPANSLIQNGNSNVSVLANGNVLVGVAGNANVVVFTDTGVNVNGYLTTSGNITTTSNLSVGNANLGNAATANYFIGSGNNLSNIQAGNVTGIVGAASIANTVVDNAQPNITSVGTLTSLAVSGNISAGNANLGNAVTANFFIGDGYYLSNINTGNVGTVANANYAAYAGNVTVNAQPNITSLGTLSSLAVTGNVTAGNMYANSGTIGASLLTGTLTTNAQPNITSLGTLTGLTVSGNIGAGNANLGNAVTANYFIGSGNNLSNIQASNITGTVANANYSAYAGQVVDASQSNITSLGTLTGLTINGNLNVGNVSGANAISANYFIGSGNLLTNVQANVYLISNGNSNVVAAANSNVTVSVAGNANIVTVTGTGVNVAGTLNVTGNANVGNIGATGVVATTISGSLTTANQPNVTSVGNLTSLTSSGNIDFTNASNVALGAVSNLHITGGSNATFLSTDGTGNLAWTGIVNQPPGGSNNSIQYKDGGTYQGNANLTWDNANSLLTVVGNITASNANLGNAVVANYFTGTLTTNAQPNITSVGTLTSLAVNGNINALNVSGGNVVSANYFTGTLTTNAQPNITSVGTLTSLGVNGTVTAVAFTANTGVFTGNGSGLSQLTGANVTGTVANATYATSAGSATTAGTVTTNAQPNITSVGTLTSLAVNGNINAGNISGGNLVKANFFQGDGYLLSNLTIAAGSSIVNGNSNVLVTANSNVNTSVAGVANVLVVTSTGANIAGTFNVTGNANVGNIGATNGVFTNVSGNGASLTSLTGANVTGTVANATYATSAGSATTAGTVTTAAQPNITSVGTLSSLSVSGNTTSGNVYANSGTVGGSLLTGTLTTAAQPNVTSVGTLSSLAVTANVTAGNVYANSGTGGFTTLSASGNITGGNVYANSGTIGATTLTASGNVSGANVNATAYNITGVTTGISAAGTTQGTATALSKAISVVSTVSSGANGVVLPAAVAGMSIYITNSSANTLNVFPASGGAINTGATNASYSQPAGSTVHYIAPTTSQWYTVTGTYA